MAVIKVSTDDLVSVQDAAKEFGRPRIAVYRMIERGDIISLRFNGILYIPVTEIVRLKRQREIEDQLEEQRKQKADQERQAEIERLEKELERLRDKHGEVKSNE